MGKKNGVQKKEIVNWHFKKASQLRSSWRSRARKNNIPVESVPTRVEIQLWLESQDPIKCYLSDSIISIQTVEVDHKIPITRGGSFNLNNLGITSKFYNSAKGSLTEKEFRQLLKCISKWEDKGLSLLKRLISSNNIYKRKR